MQSAQNECEQVATSLNIFGSAKQKQHTLSSTSLACYRSSGNTDVLTVTTSSLK